MKPLPRREVIRKFRGFGFDGPFAGSRHPYMTRERQKIHIPGEHRGDVAVWLQLKLIRQANISNEDWESA